MGFGLCITRRIGESVMIGDDVEVTVTHFVCGSQVQLSIVAPRDVVVHRTEVWQRIRLERQRKSPKPGGIEMRTPRERTG